MDDTIILIHGALGSSSQMDPLAALFEEKFRIIKPDLPGHGKRVSENVFSIQAFAEDIAERINSSPGKTFIFGYSMGGYVALSLALTHPGLVSGIITLGTRLNWNPTIAENECKMLVPANVIAKVPAFASELENRHGNWEYVMERTAGLLRELGQNNVLRSEDYPNIKSDVLLMLGDKDKMVSLEETADAFKAMPSAQMAVLPNTPHPFEKVDTNLVHYLINRFISGGQ